MKKLIIIAILTIAFAREAFAQTDYNCVNQCLREGYLYGYCNSICTF